VLVVGVGAAIHQPLSRVPENSLKFVVGLMLSAFGTFWAAEGAGAVWPGADLSIIAILVAYTAFAALLVRTLAERPAVRARAA